MALVRWYSSTQVDCPPHARLLPPLALLDHCPLSYCPLSYCSSTPAGYPLPAPPFLLPALALLLRPLPLMQVALLVLALALTLALVKSAWRLRWWV